MNTIDFGNKLFELRKSKNMSQTQLGEMLGVSNKAVSKWETGNALPKTEIICNLAEIFDISVEDLLLEKSPSGKAFENVKAKSEEYRAIIERDSQRRWLKAYFLTIGIVALIGIIFNLIILSLFSIEDYLEILSAEYAGYIESTDIAFLLFALLYFLVAGISGVFLAVKFISKQSIVVIILSIILWPFVLFVITMFGAIAFVPYFIINLQKIIKEKK